MRIFSHHSENTLRKTLSPVSNLNLGEAVRHLFMISVTVISTSTAPIYRNDDTGNIFHLYLLDLLSVSPT